MAGAFDPATNERLGAALRAVLDSLPVTAGRDGWTLDSMLLRVEREIIAAFLSACGGDPGACARMLDVQYHTFLRRAERAGLYSPTHRKPKTGRRKRRG